MYINVCIINVQVTKLRLGIDLSMFSILKEINFGVYAIPQTQCLWDFCLYIILLKYAIFLR